MRCASNRFFHSCHVGDGSIHSVSAFFVGNLPGYANPEEVFQGSSIAPTWVWCWLLVSDQASSRYSTKLRLNCSGAARYALFGFSAKVCATPLFGTGSDLVCLVRERGAVSCEILFLFLLPAFSALCPLGIILMALARASTDHASTVSGSPILNVEQ